MAFPSNSQREHPRKKTPTSFSESQIGGLPLFGAAERNIRPPPISNARAGGVRFALGVTASGEVKASTSMVMSKSGFGAELSHPIHRIVTVKGTCRKSIATLYSTPQAYQSSENHAILGVHLGQSDGTFRTFQPS